MINLHSDRLQEGFRSLAELPSPEVSDELRERIWLAVSGELPPAERRAIVERMATDAACAEAWRVAYEMWHVFQPTDRTAPTSRVGRAGQDESTYHSWASHWLAAAATLVLATGLVYLFDRPPADEFRTAPGYAVTSVVPADAPLPRDRFRLQWTAAPDGSRYQVRVTREDLEVLATATGLSAPEFVVPAAQLAALPDGAGVFWQVDVLLPSGERITSPTFVVRVQ